MYINQGSHTGASPQPHRESNMYTYQVMVKATSGEWFIGGAYMRYAEAVEALVAWERKGLLCELWNMS